MARTRSPQYPAIGLKEAIEKVSAVYTKDYQTPTQRDVIASHMGYNSLNGKSLGVLSAVGKYGLLEGRGSEYRVSDLAVRILAHQPGDPERAGAIQEAASLPDLFQELDKRFTNGKASDQAIRSYLMMQKFIPAAADAAIRSYRETKQLVEQEAGAYDGAEDQVARSKPPMPTLPRSTQQQKGEPTPPLHADLAERSTMRVGLTEKGIEVEATLIDVKGIDRLIKALQINRPLLAENTFDPVATETPKLPDDDPPRLAPERSGASVALMITKEQKAALRERGYTDDQIRDMNPEDAHRVLGIVN